MIRIFLLATLFVAPVFGAETAPLPGGECLKCHTEMEDSVAELWKTDIHALGGFSCVYCHGGDDNQPDKDRAKLRRTGYRGILKKTDIPVLCGNCHANPKFMKQYNLTLPTNQLSDYWKSTHGKDLKKGDRNVAQCASCHGYHGIRKVTDPKSPVYPTHVPKMCATCHADEKLMKPYNRPVTIYDDYLHSVHAKALLEKGDTRGSPACNDCHGNHDTAKPGPAAITGICGSCHAPEAELFLKSKMAKPLQEFPYRSCVSCHNNHLILPLTTDVVGDAPNNTCMGCHKPGDPGALIAAMYRKRMTALREGIRETESQLEYASRAGAEVSEGSDELQTVTQSILSIRRTLHAFTGSVIEKQFGESEASLTKASGIAKAALAQFKHRYVWLAASCILLFFFAVFLAFKIRSLPK